MEEKEKFVPMGTKISADMAVVWDAVCNALETDTYNLLQQFIQSTIKAASTPHEKSQEVERLLNMLDIDVGWQNAINICAPNGKLSIAQMILIVEQENKEGFEAIMLNKPFMGECQQTENADKIFERLVEVIFKRTYLRLRMLGSKLHVESQRALLEKMIDTETDANLSAEEWEEMHGLNDFAENNRRVEYGKRTKRVKHQSVDMYEQSSLDFFADDERAQQDAEHAEQERLERERNSEEARKWLEEHSNGERPFDMEW